MRITLSRLRSYVVSGSRTNKVFDLLLIPVVALIVLARTVDLFDANILMISVGLAYAARLVFLDADDPQIWLNWIDVSVVVVLATEILVYITSSYKPNTFLFMADLLFLQVFYWIIRFNLRHVYQL